MDLHLRLARNPPAHFVETTDYKRRPILHRINDKLIYLGSCDKLLNNKKDIVRYKGIEDDKMQREAVKTFLKIHKERDEDFNKRNQKNMQPQQSRLGRLLPPCFF